MEPARLPFKVKLEKFNIRYHEGTKAVADYESIISIGGDGPTNRYTVSMNRIASHGGVRFYQSSYDEDGRGSVLAINSDPYGIPVTYVGYALLFFSLLWLLVDPRGTFRRLLRSDVLRKGALAILALMALQQPAAATTTFPRRTADHFGRMSVLYNDRIAPLQTYAYDLTKKLCGKRSYRGCTPEQVLTGFIFWGDQWTGEKIIKVKGGQLKSTLQLPDYVSVNDLFLAGDYRLKQSVEEYYHGAQDGFHQDAVELDEKVQLIMELRGGAPLKIFPHTAKGSTQWYAPNRSYKGAVSARDSAYMQQVFADLYRYALSGSNADVNKTIDEVMAYQQRNGGAGMPSPREVEAERLYNSVPFATILFVVNLTLGLIALGLTIRKLTGKDDTSARPTGKRSLMARLSAASGPLFVVLMVLSMLALTVALALRRIISGYVPMSNGYETMLVVAWFTQLLSLLAWRTLTAEQVPSADGAKDFETSALREIGLLNSQIPPRYSTSYFNHVWGGGYAAGYYSYLWSEVLAVNIADYFAAHGALTPTVGQSFRDKVLSRGNTLDLMQMFSDFTGLPAPDATALLKARGL